MYLTPEEFKILNAIKSGLSQQEIKQQFGITMYFNDPRLSSLYKKYGIKNEGKGLKYALFQKADINKAEVVNIDEIPYFEYENNTLVKKIKITKEDFSALEKFFKKVKNKNKEYELILDEDAFNMYRFLSVKDVLTGKKFDLCREADGIKINENKNILLIGVGGGGVNIINYLSANYNDFKFLSVNSDEQALNLSKTEKILLCNNPPAFNLLLQIKKLLNKTAHLGCGGNMEQAKYYALTCEKIIKKQINKADKIVLVSCFGGGTGTGATPIIAKYARDLGIQVEAIIIYPFRFEGTKRIQRAKDGLVELKKYTNCIFELYNENLFEMGKENSLIKEFGIVNEKIGKIIIENLK